VHLFGFAIEIHYDAARSCKGQMT